MAGAARLACRALACGVWGRGRMPACRNIRRRAYSKRIREKRNRSACGRWRQRRDGRSQGAYDVETQGQSKQLEGRRQKNTSAWTDRFLENALNSITNDGMSFREASKVYGIPTTSIRDHLYGRTTSRQKDIRPVLAAYEEKKIVDYVFNMQDLGHPLTLAELRLKVATAIQTRSTPWNASGVLSRGCLHIFCSRHPEISSRRSHKG